MLRREALDISVAPTAAGTPIIRRDTNTVIFTLDRAEALELISDITKNFGNGSFDKVVVVLEADHIYPKDMD
jgi:hypothetical protein